MGLGFLFWGSGSRSYFQGFLTLRGLQVWELLQYEGDILCLQEVSRDVYETYLAPLLAARGYRGVYANKISQHTAIGCAVTYTLYPVPRTLSPKPRTLKQKPSSLSRRARFQKTRNTCR